MISAKVVAIGALLLMSGLLIMIILRVSRDFASQSIARRIRRAENFCSGAYLAMCIFCAAYLVIGLWVEVLK